MIIWLYRILITLLPFLEIRVASTTIHEYGAFADLDILERKMYYFHVFFFFVLFQIRHIHYRHCDVNRSNKDNANVVSGHKNWRHEFSCRNCHLRFIRVCNIG